MNERVKKGMSRSFKPKDMIIIMYLYLHLYTTKIKNKYVLPDLTKISRFMEGIWIYI